VLLLQCSDALCVCIAAPRSVRVLVVLQPSYKLQANWSRNHAAANRH
jgi:hypothetical protein